MNDVLHLSSMLAQIAPTIHELANREIGNEWYRFWFGFTARAMLGVGIGGTFFCLIYAFGLLVIGADLAFPHLVFIALIPLGIAITVFMLLTHLAERLTARASNLRSSRTLAAFGWELRQIAINLTQHMDHWSRSLIDQDDVLVQYRLVLLTVDSLIDEIESALHMSFDDPRNEDETANKTIQIFAKFKSKQPQT